MDKNLCLKCGKCCTSRNCNFLENNLCKIYENRPIFCKDFPSTIWEKLPQGCGYEGWQFLEQEKIKSKIRKLKEQLVELKTLDKNNPQIQKLIDEITQYNKYGAEFW